MITRDGYEPTIHDFAKEPGKLKEIRLSLKAVGSSPATNTAGQGILQLNITPPGAQVLVNGILTGTSPLVTPIVTQAGVANVQVSMPGYKTWAARVQVVAGNTTRLQIQLVPMGSTQPIRPVITPMSATPTSEPQQADTTTGWALTGTGIGLSIGGALMVALPAVLNQRKINLATRFEINGQQYISGVTRQEALDLESQAQLLSYIGYGTLGAGVILTVTGAVLVAQAKSSNTNAATETDTAPSLSVSPIYLPGGGGASATWRF
jgi:hypothetical protein